MEAECLYNFEASNDDELSFQKGDVLKIVENEVDPNWFYAELRGKVGNVPSNYLKLKQASWMHMITRAQAELMLLTDDGKVVQQDGSFVVRNGKLEGEFSMSVKWNNAVQHFKIYRDAQKKYYIWETDKFRTLHALVQHYKATSISKGQFIVLKEMTEFQKQAKAMYDFTSGEPDELPFKKGEIMVIVDDSDENWWMAKLHGNEGMIPSTYVKLI